MSRYNGIRPVTNGLVFCIDPTNRQSYVSGSTLVNDLVGTTTGATLFNGPTFSTGSTSNFITFDGTNDYFDANYVHNQSNHTVITFVKLSTLNDDWIPIIEFGSTGGVLPWRAHYYIQGLDSTLFTGYKRGFGGNFFNGTTSYEQWATPVLFETNANQWLMLTARLNGTSGDTFVNKNQSRPTTTGISYSNIPITSIGNTRLSQSYYYGGNLGLVLYYNRALTDNEIIQTYNAYQNRFNLPGDIVTNGLVLNLDTAYYNSYPRSGTTWSDLSGSGNNGTLTNGPTYVVTGASSSMQFDGVDDYVKVDYASTLAPSIISFNTWVYSDNWSARTGNQKIFSKTQIGGYALGCTIFTSDSLEFIAYIDGSYKSVTYPLSSLGSGWKNIQGSFNGRYINLYINGILVNTYDNITTSTITYTDNNQLIIAAEPGFGTSIDGNFFKGNIATVQFYNRALSATEVSQNFNALRGRFGI
jgi:hypothetical protein